LKLFKLHIQLFTIPHSIFYFQVKDQRHATYILCANCFFYRVTWTHNPSEQFENKLSGFSKWIALKIPIIEICNVVNNNDIIYSAFMTFKFDTVSWKVHKKIYTSLPRKWVSQYKTNFVQMSIFSKWQY
jgi:hypothetical protein